MTQKQHDLDHEVYLDPKDHKEHINHGMLEYSEADLKDVHANYDGYHKDDVVDKNDKKVRSLMNKLKNKGGYSLGGEVKAFF